MADIQAMILPYHHNAATFAVIRTDPHKYLIPHNSSKLSNRNMKTVWLSYFRINLYFNSSNKNSRNGKAYVGGYYYPSVSLTLPSPSNN